MEEKFCFLCQESKNDVGHTTESCPNVTCRTCGLKGHSTKYCPDLNPENYKNSKKSCRSKQIFKDSDCCQTELHLKPDKKPKKLDSKVLLCQKSCTEIVEYKSKSLLAPIKERGPVRFKNCPDLIQEATEKTKKSNSVEEVKKNLTFDNPFLNAFSKLPGREEEIDFNANRIKSAKNEEKLAKTILIPTEAKNPNWKQLHTTFLT